MAEMQFLAKLAEKLSPRAPRLPATASFPSALKRRARSFAGPLLFEPPKAWPQTSDSSGFVLDRPGL